MARTVTGTSFTPESVSLPTTLLHGVLTTQESPLCQAIEVFSDLSGIYRTFEASASSGIDSARFDGPATASRSTAIRLGQQSRMQLTQQQIKRLQDEKPAISVETGTAESAMHANRGTQWLAVLTKTGEFQVCFRSHGGAWRRDRSS